MDFVKTPLFLWVMLGTFILLVLGAPFWLVIALNFGVIMYFTTQNQNQDQDQNRNQDQDQDQDQNLRDFFDE